MPAKKRATRRTRSAAVVTVFDAPKFDAAGRKAIGRWLREQADYIEQYGSALARRFTARYLY